MEIDVERLRNDLEDYYGTAMHSGFPMAVLDLGKVSRASERELIEMAEKKGIDLRRYCK